MEFHQCQFYYQLIREINQNFEIYFYAKKLFLFFALIFNVEVILCIEAYQFITYREFFFFNFNGSNLKSKQISIVACIYAFMLSVLLINRQY